MASAPGQNDGPAASRGAEAVLHDVRNLLTTVAALTVKARNALEGEGGPDTVEASRAIHELGRAVGNAMTMARSSGRPPATLDDVPLVDYVIEHAPALGAIVGGADHFQVRVADGIRDAHVRMDATDLLRVLVNVLRNAEEASGSRAEIEMELDVVDVAAPVLARPNELPPRRYAIVRVSDRGEGIDDGLLDVLIEPAASSKGDGPGRGLSVVAQLLDEASGGLRVTPHADGGAAIELYVPTGTS